MTFLVIDIKHATKATECCGKPIQHVLWESVKASRSSPNTCLKMISSSLVNGMGSWHIQYTRHLICSPPLIAQPQWKLLPGSSLSYDTQQCDKPQLSILCHTTGSPHVIIHKATALQGLR